MKINSLFSKKYSPILINLINKYIIIIYILTYYIISIFFIFFIFNELNDLLILTNNINKIINTNVILNTEYCINNFSSDKLESNNIITSFFKLFKINRQDYYLPFYNKTSIITNNIVNYTDNYNIINSNYELYYLRYKLALLAAQNQEITSLINDLHTILKEYKEVNNFLQKE
jgi:hypothetical protein